MISEQEVEKREKALRIAMERILPDFVKSCQDTVDTLLIHQDAFAPDLHPETSLSSVMSSTPLPLWKSFRDILITVPGIAISCSRSPGITDHHRPESPKFIQDNGPTGERRCRRHRSFHKLLGRGNCTASRTGF
jgi:hypothetical protein